jgi:hypothetical protein
MIVRVNRRRRKKRIVILGGGFGGVYAAIHLEKLLAREGAVEICLVSRDNFFLFTPMLHEIAASDLEITNIVNPLRKLLRKVEVVVGDVKDIDLPNKRVLISHGYRNDSLQIGYDHLVIALGSITNLYIDRDNRYCAQSSIWFPKSLTKVIPPTFRKRRELARLAEKILVHGVRCVQANDRSDANCKVAPGDQRDRVASLDFALPSHRQIEAGSAASQETLHHVRPAEADAKLEARHARLRNHELSRTNPELVSDANSILDKTLRREVLAECTPRKVHPREFFTPECVVLRRIRVDSLIRAAMHCQIRLLVAFYV